MITYGQLAARISRRPCAKPAGPPTPDTPTAPRRRPARTTAALTTLPVAAATIATAALLPWAVTQDTVYIASHLTHAPSAVPAGTIMNVQVRRSSSPRRVMDIWTGDDNLRIEDFTQAGKPAYDSRSTRTRTAFTQVTVNYPDKTWTRETRTPGARGQVMQADYQWLPPTAANLAKLNLPAIPRGFTQAPG